MGEKKLYNVCKADGRPNLDSVPVAKIVEYPLELRDYKPFAQCVLCLSADKLYIRMWAFEVSPAPTSALRCILYVFPEQPECAVELAIEHGEGDYTAFNVRTLENGKYTGFVAELAEAAEYRPYNGEDLQGVYWGGTVALPLERTAWTSALALGKEFPGNFYKTCENNRFAHKGSFSSVDFPENPYASQSMGIFRVVPY